jgi:hypothetical protein
MAGLVLMTITNTNAQTNATSIKENIVSAGPVAGFGSSRVSYAPENTNSISPGYKGVGLIDRTGRHWSWGRNLSSERYSTNYPRQQRTDVQLCQRMPLSSCYFPGHQSDVLRTDIRPGQRPAMKLPEHLTTNNYDATQGQNSSSFRVLDAETDGGAGINIQLGHNVGLNIDLGYYQGITEAAEDAADIYNTDHDIDLNLGLYFDLNK